jgi:hypothetical protein
VGGLHSHDAQPCYCGEAKCVGFIGGKTQTDIAAMDDLYLDGAFTSLLRAAIGADIKNPFQPSVYQMKWTGWG